MKTRICLCVLAALLMIPVAVTAQTKKTKKEVAIQLYSVRDILNRVDNKDGKCDPAYTAILAKLAKMGYTGVEEGCRIGRNESFVFALHTWIVERGTGFR